MSLAIRSVLGVFALGVSACGPSLVPLEDVTEPVGQIGKNGLPAAGDGQVLADAEGVEMQIVLVRATADYDSNLLGVLVSEESVTLGDGYLSDGPRDKVITLDGETLTFIDGIATAKGQTFERFTYLQGTNAQVEGIYSYDGTGKSGFDVEALYLFGFETGEDTLNLRGDTATYLGRFNGFGHVADGRRVIVGSEINTSGTVAFTVDFDGGVMDGVLSGTVEHGEGMTLEGGFEGAELIGDGFASTIETICPDGVTCSGNSSLGGVFFDDGGSEIAGIIGFDETQTTGSGPFNTLRFVGAAGFSAMEEVAE